MEMKDQSVHQEIQEFLKSGEKSQRELSEIHCSALAYLLQMSEEVLDELNLQLYYTSDEGRRRLIPAVRNCRKAVLSGDVLSTSHWEVVASAMTSNPSHLRELSLRWNQNLADAGVKFLSSAMMHPNCRLETLRLRCCSLSETSYDSLASALRSNPSHLRVLDLSWNQLQDPAVKLLCGALQDPLCKLETLRWLHSSQKPKPASLLKGQQVEQKPPAEKVLSERKWWRTMKLAKLHLSSRDGLSWSCGTRYRPEEPPTNKLFSWEERALNLSSVCLSLVALKSNHSHLRVLDLSHNTLQDPGVKRLCSGLESPNCKLERLRLINCSLSEISCGSLASALRSNPSHLRELDLSENQLQDPAVKLLCGALQDPLCKLETLRWLHSSQKPKPASLLKGQQVEQKPPAEKVLSERKWWRTMKLAKLHLSSRDGLSWSCGTRYRPEEPPTNKLFSWEERALNLSSVCLSLVALKSNHSHLRVLDLSHNTLQDPGVKRLCSGLESPNCKLERLRLINCSLSEISCGSLASALRSNPSHLRELDLSENQLKDSGVKLLCGFLQDPNCRLETLG
ncbi:Ribonuclease inhibitor [Takifugu flavidus]|uniref:Ribonuclease inhibitor n=1 Tax=Takifugu flavidus TaxID=433684 RepID=A0A5C6P5H1_9TELE|nr:Ribonuclease inhibitor [Takifugu flavidus]